MTHIVWKRPDGTKEAEFSGKDFDGNGTPDLYFKEFDEKGNLVKMEEYDKESWNSPFAGPITKTEYDEEGNEISKTRIEK